MIFTRSGDDGRKNTNIREKRRRNKKDGPNSTNSKGHVRYVESVESPVHNTHCCPTRVPAIAAASVAALACRERYEAIAAPEGLEGHG